MNTITLLHTKGITNPTEDNCHNSSINTIMKKFRYTKEEAINILNRFNPDGSKKRRLLYLLIA